MDCAAGPTLVGYSRIGGYSYDPNRAAPVLLLEGGTPRLQLRLAHPTGRAMQEALGGAGGAGARGQPARRGRRYDLVGSDWASFLAAINVPEDKGVAHMHLFGWAPAFLDASQQMTQFVRASGRPRVWPPATTGIRKVERWSSRRRANATISAARTHTPKPQRMVWDDAPWIFLWVPSFVLVHSARLKGITALRDREVFGRPTPSRSETATRSRSE